MRKIATFLFLFTFTGLFVGGHTITAAINDTIPFELGADRRMYVSVQLNNNVHKTYRFLVDTGATDIVLNASIPDVMRNAVFDEEVSNVGATSSEIIPSTTPNQTLTAGRTQVNHLRFIAIPYSPEAWDGVLGLSFLKHFDVTFNYDRCEMYLRTPGSILKREHPHHISFEYRAGVPTIEVEVIINGVQHELCVELDSGSDRVLDINTPYVNAHQLLGTLPCFAISEITGTGNERGQLENVCFDNARIGHVTFPLLPGAFSTLTTGLQASDVMDGVIGNNLLMRFNQTWDFVHQRLYLSVNNRYYTPFYDFLIP